MRKKCQRCRAAFESKRNTKFCSAACNGRPPGSPNKGPRKPAAKKISIQLSETERDLLIEIANKEGRSMSGQAQHYVKDALQTLSERFQILDGKPATV